MISNIILKRKELNNQSIVGGVMKQYYLMLFLMFITIANATIINVPIDQPTIQAGIDAALESDTVLVAPGIYYEQCVYSNKDIVVASHFLTTSDTTFIETTIVDGNTQNYVFFIDNLLLLSGFTIRNGQGHAAGGIYVRGADDETPFVISHNIITGNHCISTNEGGGGIKTWIGQTIIRNNKIINNHADNDGGGILVDNGGQVSIIGNIINNNSADGNGGGISTVDIALDATIIGNTINENVAGMDGGGIDCQGSVVSMISNNKIIGNSASHYGGCIYCNNNANPVIMENTIAGNVAFAGSAIECANTSNPDIVNNTITDHIFMNTIQFINCSPLLRNNTFYHNTSSTLIQCVSGNVAIINNLIVDNTGIAISSSTSNLSINNNDFYNQPDPIFSGDIPTGIGVITQTNTNGDSCDVYSNLYGFDPCFVDVVNCDFHILENSPCIDAGDPTSPFDPDGTIADIGSFYFNQLGTLDPPQNVIIEVSGTEIQVSWDAVSGAASYKVYSSDDPYTGFVEDLTGSFLEESWQAPQPSVNKFYSVKASDDLAD